MIVSPMPTRFRRTGFTLIELLTVMAIIGVLIAISIPAVMKAREAANRTTCTNNLRQMGVACMRYQEQLGHFPTAGDGDYVGPSFYAVNSPYVGWQQDAGWGYQILPYLDEETVWTGAGAVSPTNGVNALKTPVKFFFCPSRRQIATTTYTNAAYPSQTAYSTLKGSAFTVFQSDYAACNGSLVPPAVGAGNGIVLTQYTGSTTSPARNVVQITDITDGLAHTLLLGEKAANPHLASVTILNEDDQGYASGYSGNGATTMNLNTIRFASATVLPIPDPAVTGPTGGAFGSAHFTSWNALMADISVRPISYTINPTVFVGLGTIRGQELIDETQLLN